MTRRRSALKPTFTSPRVAGIAALGASNRNRAAQRRLYMAAVLASDYGGFAAVAHPRRLSLRGAQRRSNLARSSDGEHGNERTDRREAETARDRIAGAERADRQLCAVHGLRQSRHRLRPTLRLERRAAPSPRSRRKIGMPAPAISTRRSRTAF